MQFGFHLHMAAVQGCDDSDNGKAKTGASDIALVVAIATIEPFKDVGYVFFFNADAGVNDLNAQPGLRLIRKLATRI